ncbi:hypothetical protein PPSIR1_12758 [Plesiocystis pacifica SIR-1]|uniref:PASTA domain-containing protein n=1 Tax=Plesiocystis pacifica SIR-1 TaxID=391625 RepID=A6G056_9BACT|nr:PASTA domain-containing protein [Plesiocystis pacifica]EDM80753.1 hypothetical protein PPSIR1_12758 [Plesiocystis pacifica SIR-1]
MKLDTNTLMGVMLGKQRGLSTRDALLDAAMSQALIGNSGNPAMAWIVQEQLNARRVAEAAPPAPVPGSAAAPSFVGMSLDEASALAAQRGVSLAVAFVADELAPTIESQHPAAGEAVAAGGYVVVKMATADNPDDPADPADPIPVFQNS